MADNYLEKRMDEYRNGASGVVVRKPKMPKKKVVLVHGCSSAAHLDVIRALCNGGHQVYVDKIADSMYDEVKRTLARLDVSENLSFDVAVFNCPVNTSICPRIIFTYCLEKGESDSVVETSQKHNFNVIKYPTSANGKNLAKFVRFLVDADEDVMTGQVVEVL